jgi:DNA-binding Lrp family transcriptional regulator
MLDAVDRQIVTALQGGMPLTTRPWLDLALDLGLAESEIIERLRVMKDSGVIRRVAGVPNHYKLGVTANGMSVWNVDDEFVDELGEQIGALDFVSHCYRRPRALPDWPYNLFAMIHGSNRDEVAEKAKIIENLTSDKCQSWDILYSSAILKKTGLRLARS